MKLYEANMEKLNIKPKEMFTNVFHQPVAHEKSTSLLATGEFILTYERCGFESLHDYNQLSSIKEHSSVCQNCKRKYFSCNLIESIDPETKSLIRNNLQNEWKLIALIVDRFLFWIFSICTFFSTIILLVIVPLAIRTQDIVKPLK